jgi:hypothetical protein
MKTHVLLIAAVSIISFASTGFAYQAGDPFHNSQGPAFGPGGLGPATVPERTFGPSNTSQPSVALQPASGVQPGSAEDYNLRERAEQQRRQREIGPFEDTLSGPSTRNLQPAESPLDSRFDQTQLRDRYDRDATRPLSTPQPSLPDNGPARDRSAASSPAKWLFHGELSSFILYDTYGTGAFWFRDAKNTPRLFVVFLTLDTSHAKSDGFLRYTAARAEGGVSRWAFYIGAPEHGAGGDAATAANPAGATAPAAATARGAIYLWLADPNKKKEWHLYEEATRERGQ